MKLTYFKDIDEGGFNYYLVEFPTPNSELRKEIQNWCYQSYGEPGRRRIDKQRWIDFIRLGVIYLSRESDLSLFVLRWS